MHRVHGVSTSEQALITKHTYVLRSGRKTISYARSCNEDLNSLSNRCHHGDLCV